MLSMRVKSLKFKKTFLAISAGALVLVMIPSTNASDLSVEPNYSPVNIDYPGTNVVFHIGDAAPIFKSSLTDLKGGRQVVDCRSTQDSDCRFDSTSLGFSRAILPPCDANSTTNCIVGLQISSESLQNFPTKLVKEIGGYSIPPDQSKAYIGGRSASVWALNGSESPAIFNPAVKFLVVAQLDSVWDQNNLTFYPQQISVSVFPFVEKQGDFFGDRWATDLERAQSATGQFNGTPLMYIPKVSQGLTRVSEKGRAACVFADDNYCGLLTSFRENIKVKLDMRLTSEIGGWFHGRIKNPVISIDPINSLNNLISVEAEPIKIPRLAHIADYYSLTPLEKKLFAETFWGGAVPLDLLAGPVSDSGDSAFSFLSSFRDVVGDSASGLTSAWNFKSINSGSGSECLSQKGKVLGIVSTNATAFESTAPKFIDGQLQYKVAGLHFQPDKKTENLGSYDLILNSDIARCLYGFSKAPISASVSITGGSDQKIATTIVSEKDGWLKLAAYGFTYSEKTLQVKLTQEAPVVVVPTPTPTPTQSAFNKTVAKKVTITCTKGKIIKKVTAVSPKCPKGYKKK